MELDFTITYATDRCKAVCALDLDGATNTQLEKAANYILYGKDYNGDALPEAKAILSKKTTYRKTAELSLEELMEHPTFDEASVKPIQRNVYTNPKPTISRISDADIPTMVELWEAIDRTAELHEKETDSLKKYYLKHMLIDLRKEQYYLKDMFKQTIRFLTPIRSYPHTWDWNSDCGYAATPLILSWVPSKDGTKDILTYTGETEWEWVDVAKHTIDLTNREHIHQLLNLYADLHAQCSSATEVPDIMYVLKALEKTVDRTPLSPSRRYILLRKVDGERNEKIAEEVFKKFGILYGTNYISTIWTHEICGKIANTAKVLAEECAKINDKTAWKTCKQCKREKLRISFPPKSSERDKLGKICKECVARNKKK